MMNPLFPGHWGSQRCPKSIWHYDIVGGHSENLPRSYLTHSCLCTLVTDYAIMRPSWRVTLFWFIWLRILVLLYVFNRISLGGKMLFLVEKLRQPNSSVHSTGLTSYMSRDNTQTELSVVSNREKHKTTGMKPRSPLISQLIFFARRKHVLPRQHVSPARYQWQVQYQIFVDRKYRTQCGEGPRLGTALLSTEKGWDSPKVESFWKWQHFNQVFTFCCLLPRHIFLVIITTTGIMRE